jgi:type III secretion system YscQ/HrcQ family protein
VRRGGDGEERTLLVTAPVFPKPDEPARRPGEWRPFRFQRLEQVSRVQALYAQQLEWVLPGTTDTGSVQASVLQRLKVLFEQDVQLAVDYVHTIRPKDFGRYVVDPTFVAVLSGAPHKTRGLLEIELGLAHAAIDLLLGGGGDAVALRALTDIEDGVMSFVVLEALRALAPNTDPGQPKLRLEGLAHGVEEAQQILGDEPQVVVVQLKMILGPHSGYMRLFLPASTVGMAQPLEEGPQRRARRAQAVQQHASRLVGIKTWLRAEIGRAEISSRDLAGLSVQDVVLADEITARPERGEGGTARLKIGLGRVGWLDADVVVERGRFQAKITRFMLGDAPREAAEPSEHEEQASESLAEGQAGQSVDGSAQAAQDAKEDSTNAGHSGLERKPVDENQGEGADLLNDIPLHIAVELARVPVTAEQVVSLKVGQVIDLNKVPGQPVDLSVNLKVVARGELVEVEGHLGVRILSLAG